MVDSSNMELQEKEHHWLGSVLDRAARLLVKSIINDPKHTRYITEREAGLIHRGVERGIIQIEGNIFHLPTTNKGRYDAFTLNREYFLQFATLVSLITEHNYPATACAFEYHLMDICVFQNGKPFIYIETKVGDRASQKLIDEIIHTYAGNLTSLMNQSDRGIDALRKAKYIFRDRPQYFGVINPTMEYFFRINYSETGFSLDKIPDLPKNEPGGNL